MRVIPPYAERHTGTALICGPSPSLFDDFSRARAVYPDAALIAVNSAIRAVRAQHVISQHYERSDTWRALGRHDHPGHQFLIHSQIPRDGKMASYPHVDHFWECAWEASNSAIAACVIALEMGFSEIILCGVSLDGTPGYGVQAPNGNGFWEGDVGAHAGALVMAEFETRHFQTMRGRVFAMSGAPRKLFGLPPKVEDA